jgi:hypothetical protein
MFDELYATSKLRELEEPRLAMRARLMSEVDMIRQSSSPVRRLVGPRLVAAGVWLERVGSSMLEAQPQE